MKIYIFKSQACCNMGLRDGSFKEQLKRSLKEYNDLPDWIKADDD